MSKIDPRFYRPLVVRCTLSILSLAGIMIAVKTLPITIFNLILYTSSFTTGVLQYWWFGKPMAKFEIVSMVGSYLGIVLIVMGSSEQRTTPGGTTFSLVIGFIVTFAVSLVISVGTLAIHEMKELHFAVQ